jgi:hypothetical protein
MIGIEFTLKDGTKDWYDPVNEDEFDTDQTETEYIIWNGCYTYNIPKIDVVSVKKYQLCAICQYEVGTCTHTQEED